METLDEEGSSLDFPFATTTHSGATPFGGLIYFFMRWTLMPKNMFITLPVSDYFVARSPAIPWQVPSTLETYGTGIWNQ